MSFVDRVIAAYRTFIRQRESGLVVPGPQFGAKAIGWSRRDFLRAVGITTMTSVYTPISDGIWKRDVLYLFPHQVPLVQDFPDVFLDIRLNSYWVDRSHVVDYWNAFQLR